MTKAPFKPYYKYELAHLYYVHPRTLVRKLTFFEEELNEIGYRRSQKIFTVNQTKLIFKKLGRPYLNGRQLKPKRI